MIEKIKIIGFQKHKHLVLELDPHVTTIVGSSDMGKSAILRAMKWLCLNKPRGGDFINTDATRASVSLRVDGHKITRAKGEDENTYTLDGTVLGALGNDVPQSVGDVLQVNDICFQDQHDAPFWFSLSPPEVSRRLNDVVDLTIIDTTLANLASGLRKANAEKEVVQDRLESALTERRQLKYVKEMHEDLIKVEELATRRAETALQARALEEMARKATEAQNALQGLQEAYKEGTGVIALGVRWEESVERGELLETLLREADQMIDLATVEIPDIKPLEAAGEALEKLQEKHDAVEELIRNAKEMNKAIRFFNKNTLELDEELTNEMGETCLLCDRPL